jgi:flavin reductase (DIM6/NTAB) family NADH-FMN oxidoreductase RutF
MITSAFALLLFSFDDSRPRWIRSMIKKKLFPVDKIRRFPEPGPVILLSSAYKGERDIMTAGWHMMMGFSPALVGCFIWDQNHSFSLVRRSKQCVINVPTFDMVDAVIAIGNSHGPKPDKFDKFGLTPAASSKIADDRRMFRELRMQAD